MTRKSIPCNIGGSFYVIFLHHLCPRKVKRFHKLFCQIHIVLRCHFHPLTGKDHACAYRFGKYQQISRPCPGICNDFSRMNKPDNRQSVLWREIVNCVSSDDPDSGFGSNISSAFKDFCIGIEWKLRRREHHYIKGDDRGAAHCIDITYRICCSNLSEFVWIAAYRREKVGRKHKG